MPSPPGGGAANPQSPTPSGHATTPPTQRGGEPKSFFKAGYGLINVAAALWGAFHASYRMPLLALILLLAAAIGIKRAAFATITTRRVIYSSAAALATGLACVALVLAMTPKTSDTHQRQNSNESAAILPMHAIVTRLADESLFVGAARILARSENERGGSPEKVVGRCETTHKAGKDATRLTLIVAPAAPPKAQAAETRTTPPNHTQSSEHHQHETPKESSESETGGAGSSDSANTDGNETQQASPNEPGEQSSAGPTTPSGETASSLEGSSPSGGPGGTNAGNAR